MAPETTFVIVLGAYGAAAIIALIGDALRRGAAASRLCGLLLAAGGAVSLYHAWTYKPAIAFGTFAVGAGFSGVAGLVGVLGAATVISAVPETGKTAVGQRSALAALTVIGAAITVQASDVVTLIIALEITAACGYALVAASRTRASSEAAMKYLVQGAVVTGLLIVSVGILVGVFVPAGGYRQLAGAISTDTRSPMLLGVTLLVAGLVFKAGGVPFHSWAPDAYETAPPTGSALLAGPVKLAMLTALASVAVVAGTAGAGGIAPLGSLGSILFPTIAALAVLSVLVGSLLALRQRSYTRMLAYAGVAQVGYALIAIASVDRSAAMFFTCTYAVASVGTFLAAQVFATVDAAWDGSVEGLAGLGRAKPALGLAVTLLLLSLAGIPPLFGFWGKFRAFQSAVTAALFLQERALNPLAIAYAVLAAAGIVGSIVSVAYYGSVVRALYAPPAQDTGPHNPRVSGGEIVIIALGVAVLLLGIAPLVAPFAVVVRGFVL